MKIAIMGSRGIPNAYGGFEQCAEYLSQGLVQRGHEVWVYNSHNHPYQESEWRGVHIIHCYDPEKRIGTPGQFVYDLNCILDSRKRDFDVILQLGYTSSSVWGRFLPNASVIVTNMDGLEWKRSKYSKNVQRFLRWAEGQAILSSDYLVADSIGIQDYLMATYQAPSVYIPYGAEVFEVPDPAYLAHYGLSPQGYHLLIARLVPENNIAAVLEGYAASQETLPMVVVGNGGAHEQELKARFGADGRIRFVGANYDMAMLDNLRYFCQLYFHGHSVGGTNPSLLEAMACQSMICAHDNPFNRAILGEDAYYFGSAEAVMAIFAQRQAGREQHCKQENALKIRNLYNWPSIVERYEACMAQALAAHEHFVRHHSDAQGRSDAEDDSQGYA